MVALKKDMNWSNMSIKFYYFIVNGEWDFLESLKDLFLRAGYDLEQQVMQPLPEE